MSIPEIKKPPLARDFGQPINLNTSSAPTRIIKYLKDFDQYITGKMCTIFPNKTHTRGADGELSTLEVDFLIGKGSFSRGMDLFEEKFPGYSLDFIHGKIARKEEVKNPPLELGIDKFNTEDTSTISADEAEDLRAMAAMDNFQLSFRQLLSPDDAANNDDSFQAMQTGLDTLYSLHPELLNIDAFQEMTDLFTNYPDTSALLLSDQDFTQGLLNNFSEEEIFGPNVEALKDMSLSCEAEGEQNCGIIMTIWPLNYEWDNGIGEIFQQAIAEREAE